jgi:hypothetical protein
MTVSDLGESVSLSRDESGKVNNTCGSQFGTGVTVCTMWRR